MADNRAIASPEHFPPLPVNKIEGPFSRDELLRWLQRQTIQFANLRITGDIFSSNWDGASPANLASLDATATVGFYLDSSEGSAQFEGNIFVGGNLYLKAGGELATSSSSSDDRVVIGTSSGGGTALVRWTLGNPATTFTHGQVRVQSSPSVPLGSTTRFITFHDNGIEVALGDLLTGSDQVFSVVLAPNGNKLFAVDNDGAFLDAGTVSLPSLSFDGDRDTGLYRHAANQLAAAAGGVEQFRTGNGGSPGIIIPVVSATRTATLHVASGNGVKAGEFYHPGTSATFVVLDVSSDVTSTQAQKWRVEGDGDNFNVNGTYGTISDRRLKVKSSIKPARSYLDDLAILPVRKYRLKKNPETLLGFVADEVAGVFPGLVKVGDDGMATVKTSVLVPMLVTAVQELRERVIGLEQRQAAMVS